MIAGSRLDINKSISFMFALSPRQFHWIILCAMGSDLDQVQSGGICSSTSISFSVFLLFSSFEVDCSGDLGLFLQGSTSISSAWCLFCRFLILFFFFINGSSCSPSIVSNTLYLFSVFILVFDVDRDLSLPGLFFKSFFVCDVFDDFSFLVCDVFVVQ